MSMPAEVKRRVVLATVGAVVLDIAALMFEYLCHSHMLSGISGVSAFALYIFACSLLCKAKGRARRWWWMAMLGVIGVLIVASLPNERSNAREPN